MSHRVWSWLKVNLTDRKTEAADIFLSVHLDAEDLLYVTCVLVSVSY